MIDEPEIHPRSTFVTAVAWVFIVLAGFGTMITAIQSVMMFTIFRFGEFEPSPALEDQGFQQLPLVARLMFQHPDFWFLFCFAMSLITLVAAIGLLRRHNWARVLFVVMLTLGVVWNLGAPFLSLGMTPNMDLGEADPMFASMLKMIQVFTFVFGLAVALVLGWLAWRLCRPAVRVEFVGGAQSEEAVSELAP